MATEFLREKINIAQQLVQQAELERFQLDLSLKVAAETTNDPQVDQNLQAMATNSRAQLLRVHRQLAVYRAELEKLSQELTAVTG